ncbi:MAG: hypothetical protein JXB49_00485 [Bacteroidales bacterium]|nr:hypothetical protein [Bacteroidales bacterium]
MYKSSSQTFIYKYLFPVIFIIGPVFQMVMTWNTDDPELIAHNKGFMVMYLWVLLFLVQFPFRLKNIETSEKGIVIREFKKQKFISYHDLIWITKYDITCPFFVTIKYRESDTGLEKKIAFIPAKNQQRFFRNDAMSEFIQSQIKKENNEFSDEKRPSQFRNLIILALLGLPFFLLSLYFMGELDRFF